MWLLPPDTRDREDGVALIAALLAVVVLAGLAVVFVATAVSTSRTTGIARDFEAAVHVAEAGADEIVSRVNWEKDYVTEDSGGDAHELDLALHPDEDAQREWVLGLVLDDPDLRAVTSGTSGHGFGIRPLDPATGEAHNLIFGVGLLPDRDDPQRIRIIRMQFEREFFRPDHGIQGCGNLDIAGNASITGELGSVHANGAVHIDGTSHEIEQQLSAVDGFSGNTPNAGSTDPSAEPAECPEIHAEDFYANARPPYTCYGADGCEELVGIDGNEVRWWDLCPDGTARRAGSVPCTGQIVYQAGAPGAPSNNHRGWKFQAATGVTPARWVTQSVQSGVFYVHRTNARITGSGSATVSLFLEADPSDTGQSGNLFLDASGTLVPAVEGVVMAMDRDLDMQGRASGGGLDAQGLIAVGEQADLRGTASFNGPIYIRDDPHTSKSPVSKSVVSGNFSVNYAEALDITILGSIRITAWNEMR